MSEGAVHWIVIKVFLKAQWADAAISNCHKQSAWDMCMCSSHPHISLLSIFTSFVAVQRQADQLCPWYACVRTGGKVECIFISNSLWGAKQRGWSLWAIYSTGIHLLLIHFITIMSKTWKWLWNIQGEQWGSSEEEGRRYKEGPHHMTGVTSL